jgi:hypothetical protein
MTNEPKYPKAYVKLTERDGNAFSILGNARDALRRAGVPDEECNAFVQEAQKGDYNHLLQTVMAWMHVS